MEIFLYSGSTTTQLTTNSYSDVNPQINVNGYVVWNGYEGGLDSEIFLYDGSTTNQITDNEISEGLPQINERGYVVWNRYDGSDNEIFVYDGSTTTQITNNDYDDYSPQINANGYIVWHGWEGDTDSEIFLAVPDDVGIYDENPPVSKIPKTFNLSQNYPNPSNPSTTISFDLPGMEGSKQHVSLTIFDIRGKQVRTLIDSELEPGSHRIHWNGRNDRGEHVSSGIYLYTLNSLEGTYTRKMIVFK